MTNSDYNLLQNNIDLSKEIIDGVQRDIPEHDKQPLQLVTQYIDLSKEIKDGAQRDIPEHDKQPLQLVTKKY